MVRYTDSDIQYLKSNAQTCNVDELANKLGRSTVAVYQKLRLLGIKPTGKRKVSKVVDSKELKQVSFDVHGIEITITFK